MAERKGFWKSVAGAFVEFEEPKRGASPGPASIDDTLASTEALLAELGGKGAPSRPPSTSAPHAAPSAPPPPRPPTSSGNAAPLAEGAPLSELYQKAGVPTVAHTAEQMLAILDGLAALPPEAARVAIKAMDDADDRWSVGDVVTDARLKTDVLVGHVNELASHAQAAAAAATQEAAEVDRMLAEAEAEIQKQIAALQAELDQFRADAAARRAEIDQRLTAAREGAARDSGRVQAEIARLGRISTFLGPMLPPPTPR
jgi:hypothetical protein